MIVLPEIRLIKLRVTFRAEEAGELPAYLGSTIRGVLGHALRDPVCVRPNVRCHLCDLANDCSYAFHFNSPGNVAGSVNPFVLYVSMRDKTDWRPGDLLSFDIRIFGSSTEAVDFYIAGLLAMGNYGWGVRRLKFSPVQIVNVLNGKLVWSGGTSWFHNARVETLGVVGESTDSVLCQFTGPTRVVVRRKLQRELQFEHIVRSVMTRVQLLAHAYEGVVVDWDEEKILEKAHAVRVEESDWRSVDFERYSMTYNRKLHLPAIEGRVRFAGDLTSFIELLRFGEFVQIGKNTTHGFGHYDMYVV